MPGLKLRIELNVLNHLGIGLYSSTPAVITEMIANAWDADAENVLIDLQNGDGRIVLQDDGHGMDEKELQEKFLNVGYARREAEGNLSALKKRPVMGRKGLGKLAMFSLANTIEIFSKRKDGNVVSGRIDVNKLQEKIKTNIEYELEAAKDTWVPAGGSGTRIVLTDLNTQITKTESFLRPRLARRFSIIGDTSGFNVVLNGSPITKDDREFYKDIQFLWIFDKATQAELGPLCSNLAKLTDEGGTVFTECVEFMDAVPDKEYPANLLKGFIATVKEPKMLQKQDTNINQISVFAHGRVFQENILGDLGNSKVFNSYIIGEVHADFLDADKIDRATTNREAIKQNDKDYLRVRGHLQARLKEIGDRWDEWRRELGYKKSAEPNSVIQSWIDGLQDKRDKKLADKLMVSISNLRLSNDDQDDHRLKMQLYKSTILGFEKLRIRKDLDRLEQVSNIFSPEFHSIFNSINDIEETYYHDITRSRIDVIDKFKDLTDAAVLEKVAQQYLFENLWLLDPTWGRVKGSEAMEQTLSAALKKACPDSAVGARLDIAYRTSSGRHAIIELKRPGKDNLDFTDLLAQIRKYRIAMEQWFKDNPDAWNLNGRVPPIDIYLLVQKDPSFDDSDRNSLKAQSAQIMTYTGLIQNARASYEEYLQTHAAKSKIDDILGQLG